VTVTVTVVVVAPVMVAALVIGHPPVALIDTVDDGNHLPPFQSTRR
jgi:hypothetical protein